MEQLDSTIITTAIPDMARGLGQTPLRLNLALTSYILSLAVFIPVSGWIADRFGMRRTFCAAIALFTLGSALCGAAVDFPMLVASRVVQGFGGAMMTPVGRLILLRSFPRSEFVTAISYMSLPALIGPTLGPLAGGLITTHASWRWIFYVNIPFGVLGLALAWRFIRDLPAPPPGRFDTGGFLLCGAGMALLQIGIESLGNGLGGAGVTILLFAAAGALLWVYGRHARTHANAALDLSQLEVRSFRVALTAGGLCRVGINAIPFMLPLLLQLGFGLSAVESGSITFVASLGTLVMRTVTVRLLRRLGFDRLLVAGAVANAAVIAGFALIGPGTPHGWLLAYVLLFGMVRSTQFNAIQTLTFADIPPSGLSRATSLSGVAQQMTMGFGVSAAATLLGLVAGEGHRLTVPDFHLVFLLVALLPLLAIPGLRRLTAQDGANVSRHVRVMRG